MDHAGTVHWANDPRVGRLVGNFPQAFTHVALVNSAIALMASENPLDQRAKPEEAALPA